VSEKAMTPSAASRIQSASAKSGNNSGFASRAQSAAAKNSGKK
jgi:hypothetical protein